MLWRSCILPIKRKHSLWMNRLGEKTKTASMPMPLLLLSFSFFRQCTRRNWLKWWKKMPNSCDSQKKREENTNDFLFISIHSMVYARVQRTSWLVFVCLLDGVRLLARSWSSIMRLFSIHLGKILIEYYVTHLLHLYFRCCLHLDLVFF